jgi:hypothetical protein
MLRRITGFSAGLLFAFTVHAETTTNPVEPSAPATVLKAARLFDGAAASSANRASSSSRASASSRGQGRGDSG